MFPLSGTLKVGLSGANVVEICIEGVSNKILAR